MIPGGLAGQLDHRIIPETPIHAVGPAALVYSLIMYGIVCTDLKEHPNRILGYDLRAVGRNIHDRYALAGSICIVNVVVAGCELGNELQIRAGINNVTRDPGLVCNNDLRIADPLHDKRGVVLSAVIDRGLAECLERCPGQIPGVLDIAVQNDNSHSISSLPSVRVIFLWFSVSQSPAGSNTSNLVSVLRNQPSFVMRLLEIARLHYRQ